SRIHGSLTNTCGEEYGFYVLETDTEVENLLKIIQEISTLSDRKEGEPRIPNFIIFAKGQDSIDHFISWANNERRNYKDEITHEKLTTSGRMSLMPHQYGITYLKSGFSDKTSF